MVWKQNKLCIHYRKFLWIFYKATRIIEYQEVRQRHVCITRRVRISVFRHISEKKLITYPNVLITYPILQNFHIDYVPPLLITYPHFQNITYPNHLLRTPMIFDYVPPLRTPYVPHWGYVGVAKKKHGLYWHSHFSTCLSSPSKNLTKRT